MPFTAHDAGVLERQRAAAVEVFGQTVASSLNVAILVANDFEYRFVFIHDHQAE
jgi:hypothetical protein